MSSPRRLPAILIADLLLFALAALGVYQTHYTPALPVSVRTISGDLVTSKAFLTVPKGSILTAIDGVPIRDRDDLEFALDAHRLGSEVNVEWKYPDGTVASARLVTIPAYGWGYFATQVFVILVFFGFGVFLRLKRPNDPAARIAHWLAFAAGSIVALTWGSNVVLSEALNLIVREFYLVASLATAALYVHFALVFPRAQARRPWLTSLYAIAAILLVWGGVTAFGAYSSSSLSAFREHLVALRGIQIYFSVAGILASILFARSYRQTTQSSERQKIKWALAGSAFSVLSYVLLWLVPQLVGYSQVVPEQFILLTSIFAPITITIAIARHRLFDIDTVLSRAATYSLTAALLIAAYVGLAALAGIVVGERLPVPLGAAIAVLVALAFEPMKKRLQRWIDSRFFRVRYNYREAHREVTDRLREIDDKAGLAEVVTDVLSKLLQPEWVTVVARETRLADLSGKGQWVEEGLDIPALPSESAAVMAVPLMPDGLAIELGPKRSGVRYTQEDVDLLRTTASQAALRLEKIALKQRLIEEELELEQAKEIGRVRTLLFNSITHDLKSPLTSIRMFAELLHGSVRDEQDAEYLRIIEGEAQRLTALIDNVLDYSRIERGTMHYSLEPVSLTEIVHTALMPLSYLVDMQGISLDVACWPGEALIAGDRAALERTLSNLVSNAIKYSGECKSVRVSLQEDGSQVVLTVEDKGIGIPASEVGNLFQPYFRVSATAKHAPGVGLGLATVQHIVQAHGGEITVSSVLGKGSSFSLSFPLLHA